MLRVLAASSAATAILGVAVASLVSLPAESLVPSNDGHTVHYRHTDRSTHWTVPTNTLTNTLVLAHWVGWFGFPNHRMPVPPYRSDDVWAIRRQIADAKNMGIDGFTVDWYGPTTDGSKKGQDDRRFIDRASRRLFDEAERVGGFRVALMYDYGALRDTGAPTRTERMAADLLYASAEYFDRPAYLRHQGKPLLFLFPYDDVVSDIDLEQIAAAVSDTNVSLIYKNPTHSAGILPHVDGFFAWSDPGGPWEADCGNWGGVYLDWFYRTMRDQAQPFDRLTAVGAVWPGFNDSLAPWRVGTPRCIAQREGRTWDDTWALALEHQPPIVQIATWNDWEEGSAIEPGVRNGTWVGTQIDAMDVITPWHTVKGTDAVSVALAAIAGRHDRAVELAYELAPPAASTGENWAQMRREFEPPLDLSGGDVLRFWFRGSPGAANSLQIGLVEPGPGESGRGYDLVHVTHDPAWAQATISLDAMKPWSIDTKQTPEHLDALFFSVLTSGGGMDVGGAGSVAFDGLQLLDSRSRPMPDAFEVAGGDLDRAARAARWIAQWPQWSRMGLVSSWPGDAAAWLYDQALALLVFSRTDVSKADKLASALVDLQNADGSWADCYDARSGAVVEEKEWAGSIGWTVYALARHAASTGNEEFRESAVRGAEWLKARQAEHANGRVVDGTEGNLDAWWAFRATGFDTEAEKLKRYLLDEAWHPGQQRWRRGYGDNEIALDPQTLGALFAEAVGERDRALAALSFAQYTLATTSFDGMVRGLDGAGPFSVWNEGTAQYIVAGGPGAQAYLADLRRQQQYASGAMAGSPDEFTGDHVWHFNRHGIAPTAWLYFAEAGGPFDNPLTLTESVDPEAVAAGSVVTFGIAVETGGTQAADVVVTDTLFPNTAFLRANPAPSAVRREDWSAGTPMPTERRGLAAIAWGGRIFAIGGHDRAGATNSVAVYDPSSDAWSQSAPMRVAREQLGVAIAGGNLYAIGGRNETGAVDTVEVYDLAADRWSLAEPLPEPRYAMAVVALGNQVYAIGGRTAGDQPTRTVFRYDLSAHAWTTEWARLAEDRDLGEPAAAVLDGRIFVITSRGELHVFVPGLSFGPFVDWRNEPSVGWRVLRSIPTPRGRAGMAVVGDHVYAIGGLGAIEGGDTALDANEAYNPGTDQWVPRAAMPTPRFGAGLAMLDGRIWVIGGTDGDRLFAQTELYTPPSLVWRSLRVDPTVPTTVTLTLTVTDTAKDADLVANSVHGDSTAGGHSSADAKARVGPFGDRALIAGGQPAQSSPSVAAGANTIYAGWEQDGRIAVSRSEGVGRSGTWATPTLLLSGTHPSLAVSSATGAQDEVHLVWRDDEKILHAVSRDGGGTFGAGAVITNTAGSPLGGAPDVAVDARGGVYVSWLTTGLEHAKGTLDVATSIDHGRTWATRVITDRFCALWFGPPKVAANPSGATVHVTWHAADVCGLPIRPQYVRSTDGGATWAREAWPPELNQRLGHGDYYPDVAVDGEDQVYIVLDRDQHYWHDVLLLTSRDGGATFAVTPTVVTDEPVRGMYVEYNEGWGPMSAPSIAVDSAGAIQVAWNSKRYGDHDIFLDQSTDGGLTFGRDQPLALGLSDQRHPAVVAIDEPPWSESYTLWFDRHGNGDIWGCLRPPASRIYLPLLLQNHSLADLPRTTALAPPTATTSPLPYGPGILPPYRNGKCGSTGLVSRGEGSTGLPLQVLCYMSLSNRPTLEKPDTFFGLRCLSASYPKKVSEIPKVDLVDKD